MNQSDSDGSTNSLTWATGDEETTFPSSVKMQILTNKSLFVSYNKSNLLFTFDSEKLFFLITL